MFLILFIIVCVLLYYRNIQQYTYFSKRNIKHDRPIPIFGNIFSLATARATETEMLANFYNRHVDEKIVGYYKGLRPELVVRDPEIIKHIMSSDFLHFYRRAHGRSSELEPLQLNVFALDGDQWKLVRNSISPIFTKKKLKTIFPVLNMCAEKLINIAKEIVSKEIDFNTSNMCERFTIAFIGAWGFGIDTNTINNEYSLFLGLSKMIFIKSSWQKIIFALRELFPDSFKNKISLGNPHVRLQLIEILKIIREQRKDDTEPRDDYINLLLELEKAGKLYGESLELDENGQPKKIELEFDDAYITAQLFIFFAAGFETSSATMSYTLHELAYHPDIQKEIQEEIDRVFAEYNNELCYEAISELTLLEMAVKEALRIFPPAGFSARECVKDYTIPNTNFTIEAGTKIMIPIAALHKDPKHFENPEQFLPKRFSPDAKKSWHKYAYIPFGEGPRKCLGTRLGMLTVMSGVASILSTFNVHPSPASTRNLTVNRSALITNIAEGNVPLRLTLRKTPVNM